jgi:hypothetical protein
MKSASVSSKPPSKWRLKKTLKRAVDFRPIEDDDVKYVWAAYKKGALAPMGFEGTDLSAEEFKSRFEETVVTRCPATWVLFAQQKLKPIGVVFGSWAPNAQYIIIAGMCWFPWATKRNIVESMVNFLNGVRKEFMLVFYTLPEHKRTYEVCAMHGVVRRVGTSYVAIPGKASAVFETIRQ